MLRPTNPADVLSLLVMQARTQPVAACGRRSLAAGRGAALPLGGLLGEWMLDRGRRHTWVLSHRGVPVGVVSCCPYKGRGSWEIDCLKVSPGNNAALEILEDLNLVLGRLGAERLVLRLSPESQLRTTAMDAGFAPIIRERVFLRQPHERRPARGEAGQDDAAGEPALREAQDADVYQLYRLYSTSVPTPVRQLEGVTLGDWQRRQTRGDLHAERRWVSEADGKINAVLTLVRGGGRRRLVEILTNPRCAAPIGGLLAQAVRAQGAQSTLVCLLPEYLWTEEIESALEEEGFALADELTVYVKPVMARVRSVGLMPARA